MRIRIKNKPNDICRQMLNYVTEAEQHPKYPDAYRFKIHRIKVFPAKPMEEYDEYWIVSKEACEVIE